VDVFTWITIAALGLGVLVFTSARLSPMQPEPVRPRKAIGRRRLGRR
jgi:hypothetical protein